MKKSTCVFTGRLGNNLFQLANLLAYSIKYDYDFQIDFNSVFWVDGKKSWYRVPLEIFSYKFSEHEIKQHKNYFFYDPKVFNYKKHPIWLRFLNVKFNGHYLSYKYFDQIRNELLDKYFYPNDYIVEQLRSFNPKNDSIGLSVRRGDFLKLQQLHTVLSLDYYNNALTFILSQTRISEIYVFSDDLEWCRDNINNTTFHQLKNVNIIFVDGDIGIQLFKMTKLRNLILSNSSFAWWGAYLNQKVNCVVYPLDWFGPKNADKFSFDLFPLTWKGISNIKIL